MSKYILYIGIFLFSIIAQCADVARQLIFIDGHSNFGKSTTADALREHFKGKDIGLSSIDYHYTLRVWGSVLAVAEKFIAENDNWDDLESKLNQNTGEILVLRDKFKYAKDFFTRIYPASPWQALRKTRNYDVVNNFMDEIRYFCIAKDVVIVDINLELLFSLMGDSSRWDIFINDHRSLTITHVALVSDYSSYLRRYECRNSSNILTNHRANKILERRFDLNLKDLRNHSDKLDARINKMVIDISEKSTADVVNEIVSSAKNSKYYY